MKSYRFAALLALSLSASLTAPFAHAGRDESLIQQTRKNQLAHDASLDKSAQDAARAQAPQQDKNAATAQQPQPQHPQQPQHG